MSSQSAGERLSPAAKTSTNNTASKAHFAGGIEQIHRSVIEPNECEHARLRLLINVDSNGHKVYCLDCFKQGPTATNLPAARRGFWAAGLEEHFVGSGYAHAAVLSGYWGSETPRYPDSELRRMGLLP
jgi:hypothetical protein